MDERKNITEKLRIGNITDLSLLEIITLNALLEYGKPVIRYTLYVIVNEFIQSKKIDIKSIKLKNIMDCEEKLVSFIKSKEKNSADLSTSSFYNNLTNLEKRGFIAFNKNNKGRIDTIEATALTKYVIEYLLQFFMNSSVIPDFVKFDKGLTDRIIEKSGKTHLDNIMALWFSEYIQLRLVNWFKNLSDEVFILSKKDNYEDYSKTDLEGVHISKVYKKLIREPDNVIEMVAIPNYKQNINFYGMNRIQILKELHRIIRPGGMIVIVAKAEFPLTNDIAADELLKMYKKSISNTIFSKESLLEDLDECGFIKNEIFDYRGMLVGLGKVE